jgi:hypothetical protein
LWHKADIATVLNNVRPRASVFPRLGRMCAGRSSNVLCFLASSISSKTNDVKLPRVVLEFKAGISTHDVLTYSAKARKHKQVYPYLRYGVVVSHESVVPHRFFIHNEALDFFAALKNTEKKRLGDFFSRLIKREVETSQRMERIAFGEQPQFFRSEIEIKL